MTSEEQAELMRILRVRPEGISLPCHVCPRASRNAVSGIYGNALKVMLAAPPVDGKANSELCVFFSRILGLPKSAVLLESGQTSRNKVLLIRQIEKEQLIHALSSSGK